jgi:serine/threonine-protein phosphatase 2A regulatory subunit A
VRLLVVAPLIALGEALRGDPALLSQHVVPLFALLAGDRSWRIRYMLAKQFAPLAMLLQASSSPGDADPLRTFVGLLKDAEPEVRTAAAGQLVAVARFVHPDEVRAQLLPALPGVAADPSPHAKAALASCLNDFSPVIGPEAAIEHVLPLLVKLLADESSDVRLNVVGGLERTVQVIGIEPLYEELLPAVSRLSQDPQWRVREMIIGLAPTLARLLGHQRYEARLAELGLSWLDDPVWQVRRAAARCHALLVKAFGTRWALESGLVERLLQLGTHPNYLRRQTCLVLIGDLLAEGVALDYVSVGLVVPVLEGLRYDAVANVRIALAKAIQAIAPVLLTDRPDLLRDTCLPILQQLARDQDVDVQFHAERALQLIP